MAMLHQRRERNPPGSGHHCHPSSGTTSRKRTDNLPVVSAGSPGRGCRRQECEPAVSEPKNLAFAPRYRLSSINQKSPKEKTYQIRLMQTIYAKVFQVTICLGSPPDADLASILIHKLWSQLALLDPKLWFDQMFASYLRVKDRNHRATPPEWLALRRLLRNPWFEQGWVAQELVFAREVFLVYGGKYFHSEMLLGFIQVFTHTEEESLSFLTLLTREEIGHMSSSPVGIINGQLMEGLRRMHRGGKDYRASRSTQNLSHVPSH